jgi:hypothetical protein
MLEAGAAFMKLGRAATDKTFRVHLGEKDGSITIVLVGYLLPVTIAGGRGVEDSDPGTK